METPPAQAPQKGQYNPSPSWPSTATALLAVAVVFLAYAIAPALLLVFAGLVLAVAFDGLAKLTAEYTPLSRGWALVITTVLLVAALAGFVVAIAPQVAGQIGEMQKTIDAFLQEAIDWVGGTGLMPDADAEDIAEDLAGAAGTVVGYVARWGMTTLGAITSMGVVLVIAGFAAADPGLYRRGFVRLFPHRYRPLTDDALSEVAHALRWWFLSQAASMLLLGVTVALGLWVIGIELWLGLGVLTALLTFVPYLGPLIAGIPIVAIGFAAGVQTGLIVTVFYLVVQNIEANIVVPWIQHKVVHLAPVLAISVQVLMGVLFGLPGLILAAPVTVVGMILVQKVWVEATLGDEV